MRKGDVLTIVDVGANQSADCLLFNAHDTSERYSVPDTIAWGGNVYVRTGTVLRSNEGNPLATVIANEIDRQDTIGGACGKESNTLRYGHHTASSTAAGRTSSPRRASTAWAPVTSCPT